MLKPLFRTFSGLMVCKFILERLQDECFQVNVAKFLRIPVLKRIGRRLLLCIKKYYFKLKKPKVSLYTKRILIFVVFLYFLVMTKETLNRRSTLCEIIFVVAIKYSRHLLSRIPALWNFHYVELFIWSLQYSH